MRADCSGPVAKEGSVIYANNYNSPMFCDGTYWVFMGTPKKTSSNIVPSGAVMPFNRSVCPSGWTAYSNANARFVIGADGTYTRGSTGGASTVTLATANLPAHTHTVDPPSTDTDDGTHTHTWTDQYVGGSGTIAGSGSNDDYNVANTKTSSSGGTVHTHTNIDIASFLSGSSGSTTPIDIQPAYLALLHCKKD